MKCSVTSFVSMMHVICLLLVFIELPAALGLKCYDSGNSGTCSKGKSDGLCWTFPILRQCQKTCDFCNKGWTTWSQWGDCSASGCGSTGERVRVRRCRSIYKNVYCPGSEIDVKRCTRSKCEVLVNECGAGNFSCVRANSTTLETCWPSYWICDGYADCMSSSDETDCSISGGPSDRFYIASKSKDNYCLRVHDVKGLSVTWGCPHANSENVEIYAWKWHSQNNLRNMNTGKCLRAEAASVNLTKCSDNDTMQLWTCDEKGSLNLFNASVPLRYLGVDGTKFKPVMSNTAKLAWQVPDDSGTVCDKKPQWSEWGNWTDCTPDCIARGLGQTYRYRTCVNDINGHGACVGNVTQSRPCEHEQCKPRCPEGFSEHSYRTPLYNM